MTASDYQQRGKIDALPAAIKAAVIDGIINQRPLRDLAKLAGCSPTVVMRYRDRVVIPSLTGQPSGQSEREREQGRERREQSTLVENHNAKICQTSKIPSERVSTREVMRASPVKERVEKLWDRTNRYLDGLDSGDIAVAPGLLNQAHKNVELLAKLTGELGDSVKGPAFAIQIVMPGIGAAPAVTVDMSEGATIIDVGSNIGNGPKD